METRCVLVLEDGTCYPGRAFGAPAPTVDELPDPRADQPAPAAVGEVVFNTAMGGYHEVLTDPSYTGQLVVMTYPHIGNYGCDASWSEVGPEASGRAGVKPSGFVVKSLYTGPVPEGRSTLDEFLLHHGTPGITGVDTRRLTLRLRDRGSVNGIIIRSRKGPAAAGVEPEEIERAAAYLAGFPPMKGRSLIAHVGTSEPVSIAQTGSPHVALLDCGCKAGIIDALVQAGCRVTLLPSGCEPAAVESTGCDALLVSNGPGDPAVLAGQIALVRSSLGKRPVFGICLGHQLIAEAIGGKTVKMKFGHHGVNHPVRDELRGGVFVTSQNHGFAVEEDSLPAGCRVWFRNANDGTVEGLWMDAPRVRTVQFHPEAAPGPEDARWIVSAFLETVG